MAAPAKRDKARRVAVRRVPVGVVHFKAVETPALRALPPVPAQHVGAYSVPYRPRGPNWYPSTTPAPRAPYSPPHGRNGRRTLSGCSALWHPWHNAIRFKSSLLVGSRSTLCTSSLHGDPHRSQRHPARSNTASRSKPGAVRLIRARLTLRPAGDRGTTRTPATTPRRGTTEKSRYVVPALPPGARRPRALTHGRGDGHGYIIPRGSLPARHATLYQPFFAHRILHRSRIRHALPNQR